MILYLSIIGIGVTILSLVGAFVIAPTYGFDPWLSLVFAIGGVILSILIDAIVAWITKAFPKKTFDPYHKWYTAKGSELKFYHRIGIKRWKDKIPELGKLLEHFSKSKISSPTDPEYLYAFLLKMSAGELMHFISIFTSFLIIPILCFLPYWWLFALPIALINTLLQIPPVMVQRYNRPKLISVYERALRIKKQNSNKE